MSDPRPSRNGIRLVAAQLSLFLATTALAYAFVISMGLAAPFWSDTETTKDAVPRLEELLHGEVPDSTRAVLNEMGHDPGDPPRLDAAIQWLAVAVANGVLAVAFLAFAWPAALRPFSALGTRWRNGSRVVCVAVLAIPLYFLWRRLLSSQSLLALLVAAHLESRPFLNHYVGLLDGLGVACANTMVFACAAQIVLPAGTTWTVPLLRERMRTLQNLLFSGTALLTLGVFEVWALYHWILMPWASRGDHALDPASSAARVGIGAASSIALLIAYLPPNLWLRAAARQLASQRLESAKEQSEWLSAQGLDGTGWEPLTRIATALSPALVSGPLAALVQMVSGSR